MTDKPASRKSGRPAENVYDKWIKGKETIIATACRNGATVDDLCRIIGCGKTTFHYLKKINTEFYELLKNNKEVADLEVENALFKETVRRSKKSPQKKQMELIE